MKEFKDMGFPTNVKLRMAITEWYQMVQQRQIPLPPHIICPNPYTKEEVLANYDFTEIDKFAISKQSTSFLSKTPKDVVNALTKKYRDDEMKMFRVIFRWIASLNIEAIDYQNMKTNEMRYFLNLQILNKMSYSEILCMLCNCANIECQEVKGLQKHEQYDFGEDLNHNLQGTWNVVRINKLWFLCNVNFASGSVNENERKFTTLSSIFKLHSYSRKFSYSFDEFYFLTNPEVLIYDHFPTNHKHQLLPREVDSKEFRDQVYLWKTFFELKLGIVSHPKGIIIANHIKNEILIQTSKEIPVFFSNELFIERSTWLNNETYNMANTGDVQPQKFIAMFQDRERQLLIMRFRMPQSARYKLKLFANKYYEHMTYPTCLEYIINFTKYENINVDPFPNVENSELGPNYLTTKFNFENMTPSLGMYYTTNSFTEIRFVADDEEFDIYVTVTSLYHDSVALRQYCISTFEHGHGLIKFYFPESGEYGINIYAEQRRPKYSCSCLCFNFCEKDEPKELFYDPLCSYIAVCVQQPTEKKIFPDNDKITVGKRNAFLRLGLRVEDDFQSYQECKGSICFKFLKSESCQFKIGLFSYIENKQKTDCSQYTFIENSHKNVKFYLNFPYKGMSKCFIYGKKLNSRKKYKLVYICYFDVLQEALKPVVYPEVSDKWRASETHKIIQPQKQIYRKDKVKFQLSGIKCHEMICRYASNRGNDVNFNNKENDNTTNFTCDSGIWMGDIDIGSHTADILIEIKESKNTKSFTEILRYKIFQKSGEQQTAEVDQEEERRELSSIPNSEIVNGGEIKIEDVNWSEKLETFVYISEFLNVEEEKNLKEEVEEVNVS